MQQRIAQTQSQCQFRVMAHPAKWSKLLLGGRTIQFKTKLKTTKEELIKYIVNSQNKLLKSAPDKDKNNFQKLDSGRNV